MQPPSPLLNVENLTIHLKTKLVVQNLSFQIASGEMLALVGRSGSGKTVTAYSILRLLPFYAKIDPNSSIFFHNKNLLNLPEKQLQRIRGDKISMIFQEPMSSLNPLQTIEKQIAETLILHQGLSKIKAHEKVLELLDLVEMPISQKRLNAFPHEFSGGQRQRIMIAMALANHPELLIADEPTTALDAAVQTKILKLIQNLQLKLNLAVLLITHNHEIIKQYAHRTILLHQGQGIVDTFKQQQLLHLEPLGEPTPIPSNTNTILQIKNLKVEFPIKKSFFKKKKEFFQAVDQISLSIKKGTSLGIIGQSGSGKTSLAMAILRLIQSQGKIYLQGHELNYLNQRELQPWRKKIQIVFQDPFGSLNPRMTVKQIITEGIKLHGINDSLHVEEMVNQALQDVNIPPSYKNQYPHEFSGGQRQRIAIARALALRPQIIVLDEPTSALDRSVQLQIVNLLRNLQLQYQLTYLIISHDLSIIKALSHYIAVMKAGKIIEFNHAKQIINHPEQAYTKELFSIINSSGFLQDAND